MEYNYSLSEFREIDGTGNNLSDDTLGAAGEQFLRIAEAAYADGLSEPSGGDRPSAREISNEIFAEPDPTPEPSETSDMLWAWGQFIDHDLDLFSDPDVFDAFNIPVPTGDPFFDPLGTGEAFIPLTRSGFDPATGTTSARQQVNAITSFLDGSMIYGSDPVREAALRGEGGKLKVSDGDLLPFNLDGLPNAPSSSEDFFLAGDVRANETTSLTALHTLFVREHNRIVDKIALQHPEYDADQLYQHAKAYVEAELQCITYKEFLPLLLGPDAVSDYTGYDSTVDPTISNMFASAAYRVGHTMLSSTILRLDENGAPSPFGYLALRDAFFRPAAIVDEGGLAPLFRGLSGNTMNQIDAQVVNDVRNFLFGPPGAGGFDLVSLNIQRGRDHGLPDYNTARVAFGLDAVTDWSDITSDVRLQGILEELYGTVDNIDPFVGGLVEDRFSGSMLGEFFWTVLVDQFTRTRDGDRFWYENRFSPEVVAEIEKVKLSDIIEWNTDVTHIQDYVFMFYHRMGGTAENDLMTGGNARDLMIGWTGDDILYGNHNKDQLFGDAGDDVLYGGRDGDILEGGDDDDRLYGERGNDLLKGDAGDDMLMGGRGDDQLHGGPGDDQLAGENGDDLLDGGAGDDELAGGRGIDTFFFDGRDLDDGISDTDLIVDFMLGEVLRLDGGLTLDAANPISEIDHDGDAVLDTVVRFSTGDEVVLLGISGLTESDLFAMS